MTDIEQKALALVNEVFVEYGGSPVDYYALQGDIVAKALCCAIEQHEAFRQEVSDAVEAFRNEWLQATPSRQWFQAKFGSFIIPKPVDPLREAMHDCGVDRFESWADQLREALAKRGYEIREKVGE